MLQVIDNVAKAGTNTICDITCEKNKVTITFDYDESMVRKTSTGKSYFQFVMSDPQGGAIKVTDPKGKEQVLACRFQGNLYLK